MDIGIISTRYAKTLLRFATYNKEDDRVDREMLTLADTFIKVPALQQALINPIVSDEKKVQLLICASSEQNEVSDSTQQFITLVVRNHRAPMMRFIALSYGSLYLKHKGITRGILTVPTEVSEAISLKLKQIIESRTNNTIEFKINIDPAIEGGFILQYDTYRLDASLHTQLQQLRRNLS